MSRQSEKKINEFMNGYQSTIPENGAETAYDFLELAESVKTKKEALAYVKKAVETDPGNLDALAAEAELTSATEDKLIEKYERLISKADEKLKAEGYFDDDNIGEFWRISETRPYMRLLNYYADQLVQCGKMRLAANVYEKMLKLCTDDNIGARYRLMHIYVFLEDEQSALELFKVYPEESSQFLLPLSILYYKLGNLSKSDTYLKKLCECNDDTYKFLKCVVNVDLEELLENMNPYGYRPFTIDEFLTESDENHFLFITVTAFFVWAEKKVRSMKKNKKK